MDKILEFLESEKFINECRDVQSYLRGLMDANHNLNMRTKLEFLDTLLGMSNELRCVRTKHQHEQMINEQVRQENPNFERYLDDKPQQSPREDLFENPINQQSSSSFTKPIIHQEKIPQPQQTPDDFSPPQTHKTGINNPQPQQTTKKKKFGFF